MRYCRWFDEAPCDCLDPATCDMQQYDHWPYVPRHGETCKRCT